MSRVKARSWRRVRLRRRCSQLLNRIVVVSTITGLGPKSAHSMSVSKSLNRLRCDRLKTAARAAGVDLQNGSSKRPSEFIL